jgi:superfamily I DNA/RNA helicase
MANVIYLKPTEFRELMLGLRRRGGPYQLAYQRACNIIESFRLDADVSQFITNHGENRIDHAVKYDLGHGCRLVTVQTNQCVYLLFVGTHEDTDRWIQRNAGLTITANRETNEVIVTHVTREEHGPRRPMPHLEETSITEQNIPFFKRIPDFNLLEFVNNDYLRKQLLKIDENSSDEEIMELLQEIGAQQNQLLADFLFDLLAELREGNLEGAIARVETHRGKAVSVADDAKLEAESIENLTNSERLANLTGMSKEDVDRLLSAEGFRDFMLFLHPEQKKIAEADHDKPAVLTGVSGSGKTVVLVHRARHLARKYPGERIGVITLSRSLAKLISNQLDHLCGEELRKQIHVYAFYDYFEELIRLLGPDLYLQQLHDLAEGHPYAQEIRKAIKQVRPQQFAREIDPIAGEDLDDTWDIFIDEPGVQTLYGYFREHVENHQWNIDAEEYLKEEFSLVRSSYSTRQRNELYLAKGSDDRRGRAIPFPQQIRDHVLKLLLLFEETMLVGGMLDVLSLTSSLLPHRSKIGELAPEMRFRSLLIDEYQDFSTLDLQLLRRVPTNLTENGLFLTGDPVQRVLVKELSRTAVGLDRHSTIPEKIQKNYRNSKQILEAAFLIASDYGESAKKLGEDVEILSPELAVRETAPPIVLKAEDYEDEIAQAWEKVRECLDAGAALAWSVTICTACPSVITVDQIIESKPEDLNVDARMLTGDYAENQNSVTVAPMADLKGFEFSLVVIVGCSKGALPLDGRCSAEAWRDALRLYVAMTRARDTVYLLYSEEPSPFLEKMRDKLSWPEEVPAT